ncbi:MAG: phosphoadenosine phosphosulfate reductase family protein [Planctomycetota bacterium]|nr:phosphoadenosine phosphosulfate reductase family protein [Planctomycetota bacterium]
MDYKKNNLCITNQWVTPIKECFTGLSLNGIRITCPRCKHKGLVTTRWIKGPELKPVYILHAKSSKVKRVCGLDEKQTARIRTKVKVLEGDIKRLLRSRKGYILFSGGQDSLCTLYYLKNIAKKVKGDLTALFVDTTVGLPENIKYVKKVCKYLKVPLKIVRPKEDYFTMVKTMGIPSFKSRWCCRELKIKPISDYLSSVKEPKVVFDGIRAEESAIRKQYIPIWYHPGFKCLSVSAIFHWTKERVSSYINSNGLPKTFLHSLGSSTECWCGAYKRPKDFEQLYTLNRDMFYKLVKVEQQNRSGYTFLYKNGQRIPLKELARTIKKTSSNE